MSVWKIFQACIMANLIIELRQPRIYKCTKEVRTPCINGIVKTMWRVSCTWILLGTLRKISLLIVKRITRGRLREMKFPRAYILIHSCKLKVWSHPKIMTSIKSWMRTWSITIRTISTLTLRRHLVTQTCLIKIISKLKFIHLIKVRLRKIIILG